FVLDQLHRDLDPLPLHAVTLLHVAAVRRARRLGTAHPAPQDISQMRCLGPVPERLTPSAPPAFPPARTPGSSTSARTAPGSPGPRSCSTRSALPCGVPPCGAGGAARGAWTR